MLRSVRLSLPISCCAAATLLAASAARADSEPVIAVSGRAGVPVIINGFDATGAIVEGDWGLARPGAAVTLIDPGPPFVPLPPPGAYFPATGRPPRYGRHEVDAPPPRSPARAQSYHRSWSTPADARPVTIGPVFAYPDIQVMVSRRRAIGADRGDGIGVASRRPLRHQLGTRP